MEPRLRLCPALAVRKNWSEGSPNSWRCLVGITGTGLKPNSDGLQPNSNAWTIGLHFAKVERKTLKKFVLDHLDD